MMARITVRMFATLREASGAAEAEVDAEDLPELLKRLGQQFGRPLASMLEHHAGDSEVLVVLVNGRNVIRRDFRKAKLKDGDEVSIFPPVSGG